MTDYSQSESLPEYGGLLLRITLPGEASEINQNISEDGRFTRSLSNRDVSPRGNELCLLALDENTLHSLWLGRFASNAKNESARCRGTFSNHLPLDSLSFEEQDTPSQIREALQKALAAGESRFEPLPWQAILAWIRKRRPQTTQGLAQLEELRLEPSTAAASTIEHTIAEQWDATGSAMDFGGFPRKEFLPPLNRDILSRGKPFVLSLNGAKTLEEDIVAHEMRNVPGWQSLIDCGGGIVKLRRPSTRGEPDHELTIINAHAKPLEHCLGVDLIFHQSAFNSCVLVQYKRLKRHGLTWAFDLNDPQLCKQLAAIKAFKEPTRSVGATCAPTVRSFPMSKR